MSKGKPISVFGTSIWDETLYLVHSRNPPDLGVVECDPEPGARLAAPSEAAEHDRGADGVRRAGAVRAIDVSGAGEFEQRSEAGLESLREDQQYDQAVQAGDDVRVAASSHR